jgi:hypothetical protein
MKFLVFLAIIAFVAAEFDDGSGEGSGEGDHEFPVFDRPCSERSAIIRPQVKTAFNVASVSDIFC